ncbi:MAG: hypothetical protein WCR02_01870 [Sphaerochaetaceae bacterium]
MNKKIDMRKVLSLDLGSGAGQFKVMPAKLGNNQKGFVAFYSSCYDVDMHYSMFVYPTDTLHGLAFTEKGEILWKTELGIMPSAALYCFSLLDMDGDGVDEIYIVNNSDPEHPLWIEAFVLERRNVLTGEVTGQWKWPNKGGIQRSMWYFRNHVFGGYDHGEPVLVSAQGTYADMYFQAWNPKMEKKWELAIPKDAPGARGSHSFPIVDLNFDGVDEVLWGERCLSLHDGHEVFCIDKEHWTGHSDMCQPVWDAQNRRWLVYINRESDEQIPPRIGMYDSSGNPIWTAVDWGHIHKGWVGRIGRDGTLLANGMRITGQKKDAVGRYYTGITEFVFDALSGKPIELPYSLFDTAPIDVDGDGLHEILRGVAAGTTELIDREGMVICQLGGRVAMNSKILSYPGEQVMTYYPEGMVKVFRDMNANDSSSALKRYANPVYQRNQYARNIENNICMQGGI